MLTVHTIQDMIISIVGLTDDGNDNFNGNMSLSMDNEALSHVFKLYHYPLSDTKPVNRLKNKQISFLVCMVRVLRTMCDLALLLNLIVPFTDQDTR